MANRLVAEEGEDLILPDRGADAGTPLIKQVVVSQNAVALTVVPLISVQARTVSGIKDTAMNVVGAALRSDLDLRAAEASILGVVAIGDDFSRFERNLPTA